MCMCWSYEWLRWGNDLLAFPIGTSDFRGTLFVSHLRLMEGAQIRLARHRQILKAEGCSGVYIPPQKDTNCCCISGRSICWIVLDVACRAARDHSWLVKILCYLQTCRSDLCAHRCHENIWLWLLLIQMMKKWWKRWCGWWISLQSRLTDPWLCCRCFCSDVIISAMDWN